MRHPNLLQRTAALAASWALCGLASAAALPAFDIDVGDMAAGQWQQTVTAHQGNGSVVYSVQTKPGLPGDTFWQTSYSRPSAPAPSSTSDVVANVYLLQGWDPALQGAIDRIDVQLDARGLASTFGNGTAGFLRPVVQQGGRLYSVLATDLSVLVGGSFVTLSFSQEDSDNWRAADGSGDKPDFSAAGSPLLFGYRFGLLVTCTGNGTCNPSSSSLGVDNFRVDVIAAEPAGQGVPEPAVPALLLAGWLAAGLGRRRAAADGAHSTPTCCTCSESPAGPCQTGPRACCPPRCRAAC